MTDYDSPWKDALDRYFAAFLAFFFPHIHADIAWDRGWEMLDKEFQQIVREAEQGRRCVDKLAKVWLRDGAERWLLIHVEVQTWPESDFAQRMYVYNYRIFDRYDREAISLAVLADEDPTWLPNSFGYSRWGFTTQTVFPVIKLLGYAPRWQELEAHPNPFATFVLAHLKTLETRQAPADRQAWKVRLVKGLYDRGLGGTDVLQMFCFIDWIMDLPRSLDKLYWAEIVRYQEEKRVPFITTPERIAIEKTLLKGIETCLEVKFGTEGLKLMPEIRALENNDTLDTVLAAIKTAATPDDLRRLWAP